MARKQNRPGCHSGAPALILLYSNDSKSGQKNAFQGSKHESRSINFDSLRLRG